MLDQERLLQQMNELPLYFYHFFTPQELDFSERIRWICENECPMYEKSWACPPAVGTVEECKERCMKYKNCLMISTIVEVNDIANIEETLKTRGDHETITNQVRDFMREQNIEPYVLSSEACAACEQCAYKEGKKCRLPERMHPCIESHGINILPMIEELGLMFQYGENVVTWFSLLLY